MKQYGSGLFLSPKNTEEGDIITFLDEGVEGDYEGKANVTFRILLDGEEKKITLNPTSVQNMAEVWGWNSSSWIDKTAEITHVEKPIQDQLTKYIVLKPIQLKGDGADVKIKDEDIPVVGEKADDNDNPDPAEKEEKDGKVNVKNIPF